jgi:hypothetical protein
VCCLHILVQYVLKHLRELKDFSHEAATWVLQWKACHVKITLTISHVLEQVMLALQ